MTKHLKVFNTQSDYSGSNPETNIVIPIVYYIKENGKTIYDDEKRSLILAETKNTSPTKKCIVQNEDAKFIRDDNPNIAPYGSITNLPSASYFLNLNPGDTFRIYIGYGTYYPDTSGGRYFYYFNEQGPSTHYHIGTQKPVTWSYDTYTVIEPELYIE